MPNRGASKLRITVDIDDKLLAMAQELTKIPTNTELVQEALKALVQRGECAGAGQIRRHSTRAPSIFLAAVLFDPRLLVATALAPPAQLWTDDKRLKALAESMKLSYRTTK